MEQKLPVKLWRRRTNKREEDLGERSMAEVEGVAAQLWRVMDG